MQTNQLVCKIARTKALSASVLRDQLCFFFCFRVSRLQESHAAMRRNVICILHTAYVQLDNRCIAPPRIAQAPRKGVSATRDESSTHPSLVITTGGLATVSLWERLLVCYGITIYIYIYIAVRLLSGPRLGVFNSY